MQAVTFKQVQLACSKQAGEWVQIFNIDLIEKWGLSSERTLKKLVTLRDLRVIGFNAKAWYSFKKVKIRELSTDWRDSSPSNPYLAFLFNDF